MKQQAERRFCRLLAEAYCGMTTFALSELNEKRAELAGEIILAEKRVRQLRADLAHVEAAIRILRPGIELKKVVPRDVEFRPRHFKRGQLSRLIADFMRDHVGTSVAVADIMPVAVGDRLPNSGEYRRIEVVVYEAMKKLAKRGILKADGTRREARQLSPGGTWGRQFRGS